MSETNKVLSFWKNSHNVGVLSSTDKHFIEQMERWAKRNGYTVKIVGKEKEES